MVRCFAQGGATHKDFDFGCLPVAPDLQYGLAAAFERRTAPGNGITAINTFRHQFRAIRMFANYLCTLSVPPRSLSELVPGHIDGFVEHLRDRLRDLAPEIALLKKLLIHADGISGDMVTKARERGLPRARSKSKSSYSRAEFARMADAARADLRSAAARIRRHRAELERYRAGELIDTDRRLELLDYVDLHGDVPRRRNITRAGMVVEPAKAWALTHGPAHQTVTQLHLSGAEAFAGALLLTVMTGQNKSVIMKTTAAHHRADGHTGQPATAILDAVKPRRGRRAYMNLVLEQVPDWISIPARPDELTTRDELHTPFGVYSLLVELTSRSRHLADTEELFVGFHGAGGAGVGRGIRLINPDQWFGPWAHSHDLRSDVTDSQGERLPLQVEMARTRLTYLELHQKPVAHSEETLVKDYLSRDRGNLAAYQAVVAKTLAEEVGKARAGSVIATLSPADLANVAADPGAVAAEHGIEVTTLKRLVARELDTVMAGCVDDGTGPYSRSGNSCQASFMQCLSCPCARALPHHLPIQVLVHDRLEARKDEMTLLSWTQRYGLPHAQLVDLLDRHDKVDVSDARAEITDDEQALVERFLHGELDIR